MNPFQDAARQRKTQLLVASIDAGLALLKVDPFSATALEYVLAMTDAAWVEAAKHASVNLPSETTRHAVEDIYRKRVEVRACLARIA